MDDDLFYLTLACAFLLGVLVAAARKIPGCAGQCHQGRKACDCEK